MTELALIVGIDVIGLMLALLMGRGVSVRDAGPEPIRQLGAALERAARAFLWREYRLIVATTFVLLTLSIALSALVGPGSTSLSRSTVSFWSGAGLCLGALGATCAGYVGTLLAVRGSVRAAAASATSMDRALEVAMRAAGSGALLSEALSGLSVAGLFGLLFALAGGFSLPHDHAQALASEVVRVLPSFAVGASVSALVLQRGGGAFHAASGLGATQAGEREAGLDHDDARNPAVVAELVGDHVGASATRSLDGFAGASVANVAALIIGAVLSGALPTGDPLVLIALPLVVRAFGVVASAFGLLLIRGEEARNLSPALLRGYLSSSTILLAALGGTSFWLFGEHFLALFASAALGLISVLLAAHALLLRLGQRGAPVHDGNEGLRGGSGALVAASLGAGLETTLLPVSILAVAVVLSVGIGARSGMTDGVDVCLLVFASAALSVTPFVLSIATLGAITDGARGVASVSDADGELQRRSARLDDAGYWGCAVARQYAAFSGALSSLLVAWAIAAEGQHSTLAAHSSISQNSALVWCGAFGGAVVLWYAGVVARAAVRGGREISAEVERQLRGFPREHGVAQVPGNYTPSYKTCVELTSQVSLRRALLPIAVGLATPICLGVGLRLLFGTLAPELVPQGLAWFVVVASLTGLAMALTVNAARAILSSTRRTNRDRERSASFTSSISADALSDIFGNAAAPALQLLVKATAAAALLITPFVL